MDIPENFQKHTENNEGQRQTTPETEMLQH